MKGRQRLVIAALVVAAMAAFCWPMKAVPQGITSGDGFRDNDWLNCRSFDLMTRQALLTHGQFPLRSHLVGGGFPTIAHPSDGSWAPTILAVLLLGDVLGVKVNILLALLLGCWGVFGLARRFLGLSVLSSLFAALLLGFSGWLPSMLLVGFYHQIFYLAAPGIMLLLVTSKGRPDRLLLAGLLCAAVLQQGSSAFPAQLFFLALAVYFIAAEEAPPSIPWWQRLGLPLLLLLLLLPPLALSRQLHSVIPLLLGWGAAALLVACSGHLRNFIRALWPWALRLGLVLVVASSLGTARLVGLFYLDAHGVRYQHTDVCKDQERDQVHECFYKSGPDFIRGLMQRAPSRTEYRIHSGRRIEPRSYEYSWLGLTLPPVILALAGLILARRRRAVLAALAAIFTAICFGWELPLDAHFLLTSGLPGLHLVGQPLKYFNFFILLPLVLLAAGGLNSLVDKLGSPWARRAAWIGAFALLSWPFMQNRTALGELFRLPVRPPARQSFHQVLQVGSPGWLSLPMDELRRRLDKGQEGPLMVRETDRPLVAMEYYNALREVGTIDWYGTLLLPERAVPRHYLLLDGRPVKNPRYRGEAWLQSGAGRIVSVTIRPNTIDLEVETTRPDVVVINQSYLDGFNSPDGAITRVPAPGQGASDPYGLLGVRLERPGRQTVHVEFRPTSLILGLTSSALSMLAWLVAFGWLNWRRRQKSRA